MTTIVDLKDNVQDNNKETITSFLYNEWNLLL